MTATPPPSQSLEMPKLDSRIDASMVARVFKRYGRAHISGVLEDRSAKKVYEALENETPWRRTVCDNEGARDLGYSSATDLQEELPTLLALDNLPPGAFSYRYRNFRIDEAYEEEAHGHRFLMRFFEFLNSVPFLAFAREVTGISEIVFADAQATQYRAGDYLSVYDDNVAGKKRHAAYVFNFTPTWRPKWGGFLAFPDEFGHFHEAFAPSFNALNLLRVPTPHLVTQVASMAQEGRYSITGWLRGQ
jgi:SM-20-related protein